ncbi:hypothetical protein EDD64_13565 [Effusibacillus lacus]|nr:hypothetical protein EDD64_13565 [Effusibacillus lacus]
MGFPPLFTVIYKQILRRHASPLRTTPGESGEVQKNSIKLNKSKVSIAKKNI